VTFQLMS